MSGGSTNGVLHLLAVANEAGIELTIDDFDRISERTPLLGDLKPGGRFVAKDLFEAGGVGVLAKRLDEAGVLHRDALTVTGRSGRAAVPSPSSTYVGTPTTVLPSCGPWPRPRAGRRSRRGPRAGRRSRRGPRAGHARHRPRSRVRTPPWTPTRGHHRLA